MQSFFCPYPNRVNRRRACSVPLLLVLAVMVLTGGYISRMREPELAETMDAVEKKVAITFDDEVIIGLSQEISYMKKLILRSSPILCYLGEE